MEKHYICKTKPEDTVIGYLDPKNDVAFRKVFGANKDLCISLLNSLLPLPDGGYIASLEYIEREPMLSPRLQYCSVVSARCVDNRGEEFDAVILPTYDCLSQYRFLEKIKVPIGEGVKRPKVYILTIVFEMFPEATPSTGEKVGVHRVKKAEEGEELLEDIIMVAVDTKHVGVAGDTMQDKWLGFLKYFGEESISLCLVCDEQIDKAKEILRVENFSEEEERKYVHFWNFLSIEKGIFLERR